MVYFTRDLSAAGLKKIYDRIQSRITGKTGIKLHTGEKNGPNIIPRPWVKELMADLIKILPGADFWAGGPEVSYDSEESMKATVILQSSTERP